jgi:nitrogen-specific signal transduction histidine kinase
VRSPRLDGSSPIGNKPLVAEMDNKSFMPFPNKLNSASPESISGRDGIFMEEERIGSSGLLQNGEPDLTKSGKRGIDFIESEKKDNPLDSFLKKEEVKPKESKKEGLPSEQGPSFMDSFLIELVHSIKNALASVYQATVLTMDRYDDVEIRKRSHTQVKEEIKKIDSVLNSLLNFINVNTPIIKTNTLYVILEEILEANDKQLRQKDIKINKRYEKDLPDTFIHPEQVRFILHSALQYAILSTPPSEVIGFLMKSSDNGTGAEKTLAEDKRGYIEVMMGFNGDGKPVDPSENLSEAPGDQSKGMADLILKLAKDLLERNHGMMIETHGKRSEILIALRFPIERRKVVYYEPIAL